VPSPTRQPDYEDILGAHPELTGTAKGRPNIKGQDLRSGDVVRHAQFGEGIVVSINGDETITVVFPKGGERRLMIEYAPLTKIG
jgi:DNA helicase-2/ATP-dependent DNA helicase PcrA